MNTIHRRSDRRGSFRLLAQLARAGSALAMIALLGPAAAEAAFIRVTDFVDDFDDNNGTCTLREALRSANSNAPDGVDLCQRGLATQIDQVILPPGTHVIDLSQGGSEDLAVTGDLDVLDRVVIRGTSAEFTTIEVVGGAVDRLFDVHAVGPVVIENVTLRGGSEDDGGVILNRQGAELSLDRVEVEGGLAIRGAGVYNEGDLTISRSRIAGNQTVFDSQVASRGAGVASDGAGSQLAIVDSEISSNTALDEGGGVWDRGGTLTIHRSRFVGNTAQRGGGLFIENEGFELDYVLVSGNGAEQGGGVYLNAPGEIQHSALLDNSASVAGGGLFDDAGGFLRFSTVAENAAPQGAGVFAVSSQTLLDSDTISANLGDGVYNLSGVFFENSLLAANPGGNCTGAAPAFGALNLEDVDTCGFVSSAGAPNFPNTDPLLGPLGDHGGPTPTFPLLPGSPAIDAVSSEIRMNCQQMLDQRGHPRGRPRTQNAGGGDVFLCDIGAFEATQPFVVDSLADGADADPADDLCLTATGTCTLRAAVQQANAADGLFEIELGPGTHVMQIAGTGEDAAATGDLDVLPPLEIRGAGAAQTIVDGGLFDRVFDLAPTAPLEAIGGLEAAVRISDLTIRGGDAGSESGGGLRTQVPVRLERVVLEENASTDAAVLFAGTVDAPVEIVDSTVRNHISNHPIFAYDALIERSTLTGNTGLGNGGAGEFVRVHLIDSTVSNNSSSATGAFFADEAIIDGSAIVGNSGSGAPGGVFLLEQSVFRNSIIAENTVGGVSDNCSLNPNAVTSLGFNVTDTDAADCTLDHLQDQTLTDPLLAPLADNGGPTLSHLPLEGSPVIDRGDDSACRAFDQRGLPRPADGDGDGNAVCDIGPIELPEPGLATGGSAGLLLLGWLDRRRRRRGIPLALASAGDGPSATRSPS